MGAMSIGKSKTVVSLLKIINIVDRYWEDNGSPTTFMDHIIPSLVKVALYVCICPWKGSLHLKRYLTFFKRNYMMKQGFQEVALFHTNEMWVQYKSSRKRWLWKRNMSSSLISQSPQEPLDFQKTKVRSRFGFGWSQSLCHPNALLRPFEIEPLPVY